MVPNHIFNDDHIERYWLIGASHRHHEYGLTVVFEIVLLIQEIVEATLGLQKLLLQLVNFFLQLV